MISDNIFRFKQLITKKNNSYIKKKKRRSTFVFVIGLVFLFTIFVVSLCIGSSVILSPIDVLSNLLSAIEKNGEDMTTIEVAINLRLPRALSAMGVGIGLSVAGVAYQAIIRNPLVDSYILGVSSGAGTFAIGSIAYGFTFFGLISSNSPFAVAIFAIIGGLLAFFLTIILAQRSGSTTTSYVLSGVIVGLVFSTIQTIMIIFARDEALNAVLWLFGSFAQVTKLETICILIPVVILTTVIMCFSKELNLVLLGERESQQMGLNVKRFNTVILIFASVLTSFCIAFVGIVGLVGLIIPHFCRMLFGGDHRIVIPASIVFGGSLMMISDLLTTMIIPGLELPVGAITILIGAPVFACLLFKRGKFYNG